MSELTPLLNEQEHAGRIKRRTYKAILEMSARHPLLNHGDIALMTGASETWVRSIMKSDAFMAQRAALVEEIHGPRLAEIRAKMEETTSLLLDAIAKRIANPNADVSEDTLLKAFQLLTDKILPTKQAPVPPPGSTPTAVTFNFGGLQAEDLNRARQAAINRGSVVALEHQPHLEKEKVVDVDEDGEPIQTSARLRYESGLS